MTKRTNSIISVLLLAFVLLSCDRNMVFTDSVSMPGESWELSHLPSFKIQVSDTVKSNNIYFTIRTGAKYPYRNIYLFVTTMSPDGNRLTDTLQFDLADEKGNWYGKGFGDIHELNLPYKSNVYFPMKGTYQIWVQHGMRTEELKGVYDFGVRVEKIVIH